MTDEEKENHPEYKTIGGYIKTHIVTDKDKQEWWYGLSKTDKQAVYALPNFNAEKFTKCTGIVIKEENHERIYRISHPHRQLRPLRDGGTHPEDVRPW